MLNQFTASLWGDEAFSAVLSMKPVSQIISIISRDTSPPLFNLTEHFWFKFLGTSEVAIRSLTFIYFLIAVFFTYKIGDYLWDKKTGLWAATLTFLNTFFFAYAFEGRMYSLLAATVTASFYFFLRRNWPGYVIATTLALYTHHFAIFAVFVQGLWFLKEYFFGRKKTATSIFKSFIAIVILYSPWLIPLYNQTKMVGGGFWLGRPNLKDLGTLIIKYLNITVLILFFRKWGKNWQKTSLIFSWFLIPILLTWIVSQKFQSIFFDRYLLYTIPAAMLLVASERRKISEALIIIITILLFVGDIFYFTHPFKLPFRDLAAYVKEVRHGDDYLVNWNASSHHLWEAKYYGIPAPLYNPGGGNLPFFVGTALMTKDDIISNIPLKTSGGKVNRVGVITSGAIDEINIPGYTKNEIKNFGNLKFVWMIK